ASFVSEGTLYHHGNGLQLNLNPNELLLRGKPDRVLRAQTVAQEVIAPRDVLMTMDARARDLERQIKRVWFVYGQEPRRHRESPVLFGRVKEIARELARKQVELAKTDLKADLKAEVGMAKGVGVAGLCAIWAVSLILVAIALALATMMAPWVAALLLAAADLIIGGIAGMVGWGKSV